MPSREECAAKWKDPRWQKKRLLIFERDNFTCQRCGDTETTLAVHHRYYIPGADPWDYPDDCLVTLCESCHERETEDWPQVIDHLTRVVKAKMWAADADDIAQAIDLMAPSLPANSDLLDLVMVLSRVCEHAEERQRCLDFLCGQNEDIRLWVERTRAGVLSNGFYISGGTNGYGETDSRGAET